MGFSLALVMFLGMIGSMIFRRIGMPGLLGMLFVGIVIGPHALDLLDADLMRISPDLRMIALIIILLKAGLGLNRRKIAESGRSTVFMAFVPGVLEGIGIAVLAMWLFGFSFVQGGILGFVIAAVSPAVIVPAMLKLMEKGAGMNKRIPVMILSAASLDDVFAITFFSTFVGIYLGTTTNVVLQFFEIPVAIALGVVFGAVVGVLFVAVFNRIHLRDSGKIIILVSLALFLVSLEHALEDAILIASLLGVMTIGIVIAERRRNLGKRLAVKLDKLWVFAEILLFVLIGAEVDLEIALEVGFSGLLVIVVGLLLRSAGVLLSTLKSSLDGRERLFVVVAYWPKATVQAAIGAIPLSLGITGGSLILAVSVMSIVITAPLGAVMIQRLSKTHLDQGDLQN